MKSKSTKRKKKNKKPQQEQQQVFITIEPEGIYSVSKPEWESVELAVDSGAPNIFSEMGLCIN